MSRMMKQAIVDQLVSTFEEIDSAVVLNPGRMTVEETEQLRTRLREEGFSLVHVRNKLAAIAFEKTGLGGLEAVMAGPSGVVFGGEGALPISKILVDENKKIDNLEILGAFVDGEVIDSAGVDQLSKMPGKKELQSMVLQSFFGPVSNFHQMMNDLLTEVHGLIEALEDKGGAEG